ncbi:MAG TPA: hypothetical protein VIG45_01380 [Erysipelothrix sp.]
MNLIEQLGGYERSVKFRDLKQSEIDGDIPRSTKLYGYDFGLFEWGELLDVLLEYRRANNIFEVGDVACYKNHINSSNTLFKFFHSDEYLDIIHILRHATPQEIKAWHRL